jgi:hypothetical protein
MRAALACGLLLLTAVAAHAQPRSVNITADSEPGWIPTVQQESEVAAAVSAYLAAEDEGRFADAYALMTDLQRAHQTLADYTAQAQHFNAIAGRVRTHATLTVTWTKNPAQAPLPGVYAAVDLASTYDNVDRDCGYLILYQFTDGGPFLVMREEKNFIDNASAAQIEREQSRTALDAQWAQLSANCPNFQR